MSYTFSDSSLVILSQIAYISEITILNGVHESFEVILASGVTMKKLNHIIRGVYLDGSYTPVTEREELIKALKEIA
ncbi:hypothetical protein Pam2_91 [Pseudanabaena phage Pam2]|nr:hypothetical protein Pam2_91 [Pseudanabaena phage Pam2]